MQCNVLAKFYPNPILEKWYNGIMKKMRFLMEDLETRAGVLLEAGSFLALRKERGKTCALYELYGRYVEVVVKSKEVEDIDFLNDTNRLALYVKKRELRHLIS